MLIYDVEVSPTKAMVGFLDTQTKQYHQYQHNETKAILDYIKGHTLVGFNNTKYDNIILSAMLLEKSNHQIYAISKQIIEENIPYWEFDNLITHSIDLIEVAPSMCSLKMYGARMNTHTIQDLPYDPHQVLSDSEWNEVCEYNKVDLKVTLELFNTLSNQLDIRYNINKMYNINVTSKSDAQIAEAIFAKELDIKPRDITKTIPHFVKYNPPSWLDKLRNPIIKQLLDDIKSQPIYIDQMSGKPITPDILKNVKLKLSSNLTVTMALGGLHSNESNVVYVGNMGNIDVASYYPSLIINNGWFPPQLGIRWLDVYTKIRDTRILVKHTDPVLSTVLKIVLNGTFGKLGSKYSFLYAPDLLLHTTLTGQFALLMLIERLLESGINIVSANTDGIEIQYKDNLEKSTVSSIVKGWEADTNLVMELGTYHALYSRDVNNYLAVYDGYTKGKGIFTKPSLMKNPEYPIVYEAVTKFLVDGVGVIKTITECTDITKFCTSRSVTGGAVWSNKQYPNTYEYNTYIQRGLKRNKALEKRNDVHKRQYVLADANNHYVGKVVRYYYSTEGSTMYNRISGNTIPNTQGCKPLLVLPSKFDDIDDIDYEAYITIAENIISSLTLNETTC